MILAMTRIAAGFYANAVQVNNHAFVEFCGLMNEYIKICQQTMDADIDFTECTGHGSKRLIMKPYNINYIREKLYCIFGEKI